MYRKREMSGVLKSDAARAFSIDAARAFSIDANKILRGLLTDSLLSKTGNRSEALNFLLPKRFVTLFRNINLCSENKSLSTRRFPKTRSP